MTTYANSGRATIYDSIREKYPELPAATTGPRRIAALHEYEDSHAELCEEIESTNQFYGFTRGANLLDKGIQWVYIPAVKDASAEQDESSKTALGQLLERTVRTKVDFKESIAAIRQSLEEQYKVVVDAQQIVLDDLQASMEARLREWANPGAKLKLRWHFDPNKSLVVNEPAARASIGEDTFIGEVARLGHGMQRSFLVALLQELAANNSTTSPTLLLGFEEPELYQHPPQIQHMAELLKELATTMTGNSQIIVSTHNPYFVATKGFESVRLVRKSHADNCSVVASTTFARIENLIAEALEVEPDHPSVTMVQMEQIMQPTQKELYFTRFAVLVEGNEDVAFIGTHLKLTGRWAEFRRHGCHFVVAGCKTSLSRPLAIATELCIPYFVVIDGDRDRGNTSEHKRDNSCILRLCGHADAEPLPESTSWYDNIVVWPTRILDAVQADVSEAVWLDACEAAKGKNNWVRNVKQKTMLLISATLEELHQRNVVSTSLSTLADRILSRAAVGPVAE